MTALIVAASCASAPTANPADTPEAALLLYLMRSEYPPADRVPCARLLVGRERQDPPGETLAALRQHYPALAPGSECALEAPVDTIENVPTARRNMQHTPTGRRAVSYQAEVAQQRTEGAFLLRGGYFVASRHARVCHYTVERRGGAWRVELAHDEPCAVA